MNQFSFTNFLMYTGQGQGLCWLYEGSFPIAYKIFYDLKTGKPLGGEVFIPPSAEITFEQLKPSKNGN